MVYGGKFDIVSGWTCLCLQASPKGEVTIGGQYAGALHLYTGLPDGAFIVEDAYGLDKI